MAQLSSNKCSICTDKLGQSYCYDCAKFLCVACKTIHDQFPYNKEHTMIDVTKEGRRVFKPKPICEVHKEDYLYFCKDCECLICSECIISTHAGHNSCGYKYTVDQQRQKTRIIIETLQTKLKFIEDSLEKIKNEKLPKIKLDNDEFVKQVFITASEFVRIINHARNIYETTATDYVSTESEKLFNIKNLLERHQKYYTAVSSKFDSILSEQHGITFLFEQKLIEKEYESLEQIPVIPEPIPIANFQSDSFTEVVIEGIQKKFAIRILKEKEEEIQMLKTKLDESKHSMEHVPTLINKEKTQLQNEIARVVKEAEDEKTQLNEILLKERTKSLQLKSDLERILKEKEEVIQKLHKLKHSMEQMSTLLNKEKTEVQEEKARLVKENTDEKAELNDILMKERAKSAQLQADLESIVRILKEKEEVIQKLHESKHNLEKMSTLLNKEKTQVQEENARLVKENTDEKAELNDILMKERAKSAQLQADLERILKEKEEVIQKLHESKRSMEQMSTLLNKEKTQVQEEKARLVKENTDEKAELNYFLIKERAKSAQLQADLDRIIKEKGEMIQKWKTKLAETERSMEQMSTLLNKEKTQLQEQIASLVKENKDEKAHLNDTLVKERAKSAKLQAELDSYNQDTHTGFLFKCERCRKECVFPSRCRIRDLEWWCLVCNSSSDLKFLQEVTLKVLK